MGKRHPLLPTIPGQPARRQPAAGHPRSSPPCPLRVLTALTLMVTVLGPLGPAPPVRAGSVTAESVWGRKNALQRAMEQIPRGATVTDKRCEEISVGMGNYRDRCTVRYIEDSNSESP